MKKGIMMGLTLTQFGMAVALVVGVTIKENALLRDKNALMRLRIIEDKTRYITDTVIERLKADNKLGEKYDEVVRDFVFATSSINEILYSETKTKDKEFVEKIKRIHDKYKSKSEKDFINEIIEEFRNINESK